MNTLMQVGLSNVLVVAVLTVIVWGLSWCIKRPALVHGLWVLVLVKLVTPPLFVVPVSAWWDDGAALNVEKEAVERVAMAEAVDGDDVAVLDSENRPRAPEIDERLELPQRTEFKPFLQELSEDLGPAPFVPITIREAPQPVQKTNVDEKQHSRNDSHRTPTTSWAWLTQDQVLNLLGLVWLTGSLLWLTLALVRIRCFAKLLRHAEPAPDDVQRQTADLVARMGLTRQIQVWLLPGKVSPMLWSLGGAPRLLLPKVLLTRLDEEQLGTLLAHELAHYRRGDHLVRFLEVIVLALYWWCPLVWWVRRQLNQAEEECCDAWVVWTLPGSARVYAQALVDTLEFLSQARPALPPVASGLGQVFLLRRRLTMIMRGTTPRALSRVGLFVLLGVGALLLPLVPGWAQTGEERPGAERQERERREREVQERRREGQEREREGQERKREGQERKREGQERDRDRRDRDGEGGERGKDTKEKRNRIEQLHAEMREVEKAFEKQRREFEVRMRKLHEEMRKLGVRPGPEREPFGRDRPRDDREGPGTNPFRPGGRERGPDELRRPPGTGGPGPAGPQGFERRLRMLESKVDLLLRRLERVGSRGDDRRPDGEPRRRGEGGDDGPPRRDFRQPERPDQPRERREGGGEDPGRDFRVGQ